MDTKTTQPTVIDAKRLQQLEEEIKNELSNILKNSSFGELLTKYGISGQEVLKVECLLDLTQIEVSNADNNEQKTSSQAVARSVFCKPCPVPGYPNGCWVD